MFERMDGDTEVHDPNTCRRLRYASMMNDLVAWPSRVAYLLHDVQIHVLVAPPLPFSLSPHCDPSLLPI